MNPLDLVVRSVEKVKRGYIKEVRVQFTKSFILEGGDLKDSVYSGFLTFKRDEDNNYKIICCENGKYVYVKGKGIKPSHGEIIFWESYNSLAKFEGSANKIIFKFQDQIKNCYNIAEVLTPRIVKVIYHREDSSELGEHYLD